MARARLFLTIATVAVALVGIGCDAAAPSASRRPSLDEPSAGLPTPTVGPRAVLLKNMLGPFRPKFVPVDDEMAGIVRAACLAAADPIASFGLIDQPAVAADARGLGLVSVILADAAAAFECRAKLAPDGVSATAIEPPSRLDPARTTPMEKDEVSRVSQTVIEDPDGPRTVLIGRVGPEGPQVGVVFNDETEVVAVVANGWFLAWWPGAKDPGGIVSANNRNEVQDSVEHPTELVEGRVTPGSWWVDPATPSIASKTVSVRALVRERACAGGRSPKERVRAPSIAAGTRDVTVTVWIARPAASQDCPANPEVPIRIALPAPLGARALLDGGVLPARDATTRPT